MQKKTSWLKQRLLMMTIRLLFRNSVLPFYSNLFWSKIVKKNIMCSPSFNFLETRFFYHLFVRDKFQFWKHDTRLVVRLGQTARWHFHRRSINILMCSTHAKHLTLKLVNLKCNFQFKSSCSKNSIIFVSTLFTTQS